jgi:hypothetical protein
LSSESHVQTYRESAAWVSARLPIAVLIGTPLSNQFVTMLNQSDAEQSDAENDAFVQSDGTLTW